MVQHWTASDFETVTANGVTLVDFFATWCGPCRMVAPTIERLAADFDGRAAVGKIDVDEASDLATRLHIDSIPAVIIFKDGAPVESFVGALAYETYAAALEAHL